MAARIEGRLPRLRHSTAKSTLYTCRHHCAKECAGISRSANLVMPGGLVCCEFECKMLKIALARPAAGTRMLPCTPQSLESDQLDAAICASVKVSDYYTADSSSWIRARLTTVSSSPDSLNQNKHLGSIIPSWRPLIVKSQSTLSRTGLNTKLQTQFFVCFF